MNDGGTVYKLDDGTEYIKISTAAVRDDYDPGKRYVAIESGTGNNAYVQLRDAADYEWAGYSPTEGANEGALQLYYYNYSATTHSGRFSSIGDAKSAHNGEAFIDYGTGATGTAKLYVRVRDAVNRVANVTVDGVGVPRTFDEQFGDYGVDLRTAGTYYMPDGNGTYIKSDVFGNYSTLLSLDLNKLLNSTGSSDDPNHEHVYDPETGKCECGAEKIDVLGLILEGLGKAGVETVEIGASLALDLTFSDALNWTRQMSELMAVSGSADNYFAMLVSSMAMNSAEFVSAIGLDIDLALQLQLGGLLEALPGLINAPEGSVDIMSVLPTILRGAKIYLEIAIDTNFYGADIETAAPIQLWVEISDTDELFLNIYLIAPDLGRVTDIAPYPDDENDPIGDFFASGVKIENMISLADLLASTLEQSDGDNADNSAVTAADSGIIIDIGNKNTGLLPEDIWGILDLLLGEVLFAHDMLSVGLAEDILAGLIGAAVPEFDELHLLPTFNVTGGSTGVNILFGDGSLGLQVQLGINGGFDDYASYGDLLARRGSRARA